MLGWSNRLVCTRATFLHFLWQVDHRSGCWLSARCGSSSASTNWGGGADVCVQLREHQGPVGLIFQPVRTSACFTSLNHVRGSKLRVVSRGESLRGSVQLNFLKRSIWQWFAVTAYFVKVNTLYALKIVFICKLSPLACVIRCAFVQAYIAQENTSILIFPLLSFSGHCDDVPLIVYQI